MEWKKKVDSCEVDIRKTPEGFKFKISPQCTKEQIESLNIKSIMETKCPEEKSLKNI